MHSRSTEGCLVGRGANTPRSPCFLSIWYNISTVYRRFIAVGHKVPSWPSLLSPQLHHHFKNCISSCEKRWWWRWRWILIYDPRHQRVCVVCKRSKTILIHSETISASLLSLFLLYCNCFCCCGTWPNVSSHVCMNMHVFVCVFALVGFGHN